MAGIFAFTCSCCGEVHEGSPSFAYRAPDPYLTQPEEVQSAGELGTDLCRYTDEDGEHYFARTIIEVPIHGVDEPFLWGVWASLSLESFDHYIETSDQPEEGRSYFGWLSNNLPYYQDTFPLAVEVHPRPDGQRPFLVLHEVEHEFFDDFTNGITIEKAQRIAEIGMHGETKDESRRLIEEAHSHDFASADWPFDDPVNLATFTTKYIVENRHPLMLITHDEEGDWQFLCGTTNNSDDVKISCFGCIYERHPEIAEFSNLPRGWLAWREDENSPWIREEKQPEEN
tara:strand:+ start:59236 stop:60090 length:855 start_codon:yes stop_codon:yes gene_type:complete